jgi:hypothetical protein
MTAPLPNCFSICWTARDSAESRAGSRCGEVALAFTVPCAAEPLPEFDVVPRLSRGLGAGVFGVGDVDDANDADGIDRDTGMLAGAEGFASVFSMDFATAGSFLERRVSWSAGAAGFPKAERVPPGTRQTVAWSGLCKVGRTH